MVVALTRAVSASITRCELTHLGRAGIDPDRAAAQHAAYCRALSRVGCRVIRLPPEPDLPDAVFVEDGAVVVDRLAVLTRPGAVSRRPEIRSLAEELGRHRPLGKITAPGTLDGGDVLQVGNRIWVGRSGRSNREGIRQLVDLLEPLGYHVEPLAIVGCLHLKTAVTRIGRHAVLLNPDMVDAGPFREFQVIEVDPGEPLAANALQVGDTVIYPEAFPATRLRMERAGIRVLTVPADELAKAEGGVTCCSILVP